MHNQFLSVVVSPWCLLKDIIADLNQQINLLNKLLRTIKNPKQLVIIQTDLKSFKAIKHLIEVNRI